MKAKAECIPCVQRQIIKAAQFSNIQDDEIKEVLRKVMQALLKVDWSATPPQLSHVAHRILREYVGGDPYAQVKKDSNDLALSLYPKIESIVNESDDPLRTAIRVAIAGNIIDFGAMLNFNLEHTIKDVLAKSFAYDDYALFTQQLEKASSILYFFDNAGEIVFDKLLIKKIKERKKVKLTAVVKAGPIINDATEEDIRYVGLHELVDDIRYLSNGEKGYERNSKEVGTWIKEHDLIISKGQGNYEGLSEWQGIFYMLMVKCPVIAEALNAKMGDIVLLYK